MAKKVSIPKNMPFNSFENGLFDDSTLGDDVVDGIDVVSIDIDTINSNAVAKAKDMVDDLTDFYYDEEFLKENPNFHTRVENYRENLRILLKMRDSNEELHNILIKSIGNNPSNASLFMAQNKLQTTQSAILTKITECVDKLATIIKNYQLELNFKYEQEQARHTTADENQSVDNMNTTTRGAKEFIQKMEKIEAETAEQGTLL